MANELIEADELAELQAKKASRQKRTDLGQFRDQIGELMRLDISLPIIHEWLHERKGFKTTLSALRRYVVRTFGQEHYENYVERNGWKKVKSKSTLNNVHIGANKVSESVNVNSKNAVRISEGIGADKLDSKALGERYTSTADAGGLFNKIVNKGGK